LKTITLNKTLRDIRRVSVKKSLYGKIKGLRMWDSDGVKILDETWYKGNESEQEDGSWTPE